MEEEVDSWSVTTLAGRFVILKKQRMLTCLRSRNRLSYESPSFGFLVEVRVQKYRRHTRHVSLFSALEVGAANFVPSRRDELRKSANINIALSGREEVKRECLVRTVVRLRVGENP